MNQNNRPNANSILLGIVMALSIWTLKEVVALKVAVAGLQTRLGMTLSTNGKTPL